MTITADDAKAKIENERPTLEALAESDLPVNWVAEALLEVADE